jgi:muramoyltetrapeptide carboxypeptidase
MMLKPRSLRKGSTVAVFAPASPVEQDALVQGVAYLNSMGFRTKVSDLIFSRYHYFAGSHQERASELNRLFADPGVDAIFCARGGYGCVHLLPYLDSAIIRSNPKVFLGYSDVTVLLQYLEKQNEMVCFHGPMVAREFGLGAAAFNEGIFFECMTRPAGGLSITAPFLESLRSGTAKGQLTGGCLSLLTSMLGTSCEIDTREKILFLEDVNTRPYQIDRMLMQLKLAGKFSQVRGLVFGEMLNCAQNSDGEYRLQEIIIDILSEFQFPILYGLPSGHAQSNSLTLPMGVQVTLDCDRQCLVLEEGAVV